MTVIHAIVRNGRFEPEEPIDLPEGTRVDVIARGSRPSSGDALSSEASGALPEGQIDEAWERSPEGIQAWLDWLDTPRQMLTPDEQLRFDTFMKEQRDWELAHFDERMDKLRKTFE